MSTTTNTSTHVGTDDHRRVSFAHAVGVVARREIVTRVRSKGFLVPTLIMLGILLLLAVVGPSVASMIAGSDDTIAVTAQTQDALPEDGYEPMVVGSEQEVRDAVLAGDAEAGLIPGPEPLGLTVIGEREAPTSLIQGLSVSPEVELIGTDAADPMALYFIGLGFGLVFFMSAMMFGMTMAQSVVEEKQTRIVEILLSTISTRALLTGKILGNTVLAFAQVVAYAAVALIGLAVNGGRLNLDGLGLPIVWFVGLFLLGFVMIAALYGAAASLVSRQEDIGTSTTPVTMMVMFPYFAIIALSSNPTALHVLSYIPFSAPVSVPMRVFTGDATWWQNSVSVLILAASVVIALWFAAMVYERSILRTGKALTWREVLR